MTQLPEILTTAEVAELLRVHPETVRRWWREGELAGSELPGGTLRFNREVVLAYVPSVPSEAQRAATA